MKYYILEVRIGPRLFNPREIECWHVFNNDFITVMFFGGGYSREGKFFPNFEDGRVDMTDSSSYPSLEAMIKDMGGNRYCNLTLITENL